MMSNLPAPVPLLTLFLMTEKGYNFLKITTCRFRGLFGLIVVGSDKSIQNDYEQEIIEFCEKNELRYIKRSSFSKIETEYAMAISWRWLVQHPSNKLIVFHDSLLPKYRGFAPLVNSLINGEKEIGVTAVFGANEYDTGDIIMQSKTKIDYPIKIAKAISLINNNYIEVAESIFLRLENNQSLPSIPQNNSEATYSVWLDEEDYVIDWNKSASEIVRFIDAVGYPYKGAYTKNNDKIIRITNALEVPDAKIENRHPGKVLFIQDGYPVIICGKGLLKITDALIEDKSGNLSLLPLQRFRTRFKS